MPTNRAPAEFRVGDVVRRTDHPVWTVGVVTAADDYQGRRTFLVAVYDVEGQRRSSWDCWFYPDDGVVAHAYEVPPGAARIIADRRARLGVR